MILLLGSTGYMGQAFASALRQRKEEFVSLSRAETDYTRFETLFASVEARKTKMKFYCPVNVSF